jgi:toxin-antitoxin system PIN domain toxin
MVLRGFIRVVTHPRIFESPSSVAIALTFVGAIRGAPNAVPLEPGPRHFDLFAHLSLEAGAKGNLVADAYLAALAIDTGCEWITTDRDFARFRGLRWRHPLEA